MTGYIESNKEEAEYECPICGKEYVYRGHLRNHVLDKHPGVTYCDNCESIVPASIYCIHCKAELK